jgi:TRAP-type mannitol/chloroaromatic compound transport system substrate-binding protein
MKRREFLKAGVVGGLGASVVGCAAPTTPAAPVEGENTTTATQAPEATSEIAAPGIIQSMPTINWDMPTSWPVALDTIFGGAQDVANIVGELTDGNFTITPKAGGEVAPATEVLNVVESGAFPIGHTASYYYIGKSPLTAFGTAVPFGLSAQQNNAWFYDAGGLELLQEMYAKKFGVIQFPAGNTGVQMGGWFRREITSLADLQGLKMRIPGLGGQVMTRLGVTVQVIPGGEIFQALQTGAVDAAEWVGPYDDLKLGFPDVAEYYYYPGWWEPGSTLEIQVNLAAWNELPPFYQRCLRYAAATANVQMLGRYDARNQTALQEIAAKGINVLPFPDDIMEAAKAASDEIYEEFAAADPDFSTVYESWKAFRDTVREWHRISEYAMLDFFLRDS